MHQSVCWCKPEGFKLLHGFPLVTTVQESAYFIKRAKGFTIGLKEQTKGDLCYGNA